MYLNFSERRKSELIMLYWKRVMRSKSNIGFAFDTERHQQHLKCTQTLSLPLSSFFSTKDFKCLNWENIMMIVLKLIIGGGDGVKKYMVKSYTKLNFFHTARRSLDMMLTINFLKWPPRCKEKNLCSIYKLLQ